MLSRLEQFNIRGQILPGKDGFGFPQHQVAVDQPVERRLLAWVFTVAEPLLDAVDGPHDLFIEQGLPLGSVHETDLHLR